IKANAKKDDLISYALKKMKPLEFAEDLNISLGVVGPTLNDWKSYVIKLYETDTSTDEIEWPLKPE
ncbi:tail fiber assembly protein, partial [Yersinia entomophaga]|uniref:tail fiber assembly protein n=1 Tax=Yersinia entomophaga TaxID=935293 RepID=UPI0039EF0107